MAATAIIQQLDHAEWLRSHAWPPADARWLRHEAIKRYRQAYADYRKGKAKGAKGELLEIGQIQTRRRGSKASSVGSIGDDASLAQDIQEQSIFEDSNDAHMSQMIAMIGKYRIAYRQFRSGTPHGAEGELSYIAAGLSREHLRLLPVAQLANCLALAVKDAMVKPTVLPPPRFHCHIGCGKLAMGLILPAIIRSNIPFAVIQRPTDNWEYVMEHSNKTVEVFINGESKYKLHVVRSLKDFEDRGILVQHASPLFPHLVMGDVTQEEGLRIKRKESGAAADLDASPCNDTDSTQVGGSSPETYEPKKKASSVRRSDGGEVEVIEKIPIKDVLHHTEWRIEIPEDLAKNDPENYRFVVLNPDLDPIVMRSADALSCALGPAIVPAMTSASRILPPNSGLDRPALYACENDHKAVDSIRDVLDAPLYVRECMVDRICSERVLAENGETVHLTAEPYEGEIVVTDRFLEAKPPAFAGSNVHFPRSRGEYSYLYMRKFLLVNGTHTTLAFMTLRKLCQDPHDAPGDFSLLKPDELEPLERKELTVWAAARCLLLLHSHILEVVKAAHRVETEEEVVDQLWNYASRTIERFSTVADTTKRVLGGGVTNRYQTRLRDVLTTIETFKSFPLADAILAKAGLTSMSEMKQGLQKLVNDARKFVVDETKYKYAPATN